MTVASFGPFLLRTSIANAAATCSLSQIGVRNRKGGVGRDQPERSQTFRKQKFEGGAYTGRGTLMVFYSISIK